MTKFETFTTPSGDQMAVLPLADLEKLLEAAEDIADADAYVEAKARLASGEDEMVPSAIAERLLDGENPVRVWREHRGMAAKDLAKLAGISAPYLSQIESGGRAGRLETMRRLADALKLTIDDLV